MARLAPPGHGREARGGGRRHGIAGGSPFSGSGVSGGCGFGMEDPVPPGSLERVARCGKDDVWNAGYDPDAEVPRVEGGVAPDAEQQTVTDFCLSAFGE